MPSLYSSNNVSYSVDMMFAYINIFKPKYVNIKIDKLLHVLDDKSWSDSSKPYDESKNYSANDVINDPSNYENEIKRINNANLKYPIIIYKNNIVDGIHRLVKSKILNKKTIKVFIFDGNLMKKFVVDRERDFEKVDNMELFEFIELFYKRFS